MWKTLSVHVVLHVVDGCHLNAIECGRHDLSCMQKL